MDVKKVVIYSVFSHLLLWLAIFIMVPIAMYIDMDGGAEYETQNISDYGSYPGNQYEEFPARLINTFFPEEIEPCFENIKYSYRASMVDYYGFEAYLEFTISDKEEFEEFIQEATGGNSTDPFYFDPDFQEYVIEFNGIRYDYFDCWLSDYASKENMYYQIEFAGIGKILFNPEEQRIIFIALAVRDGGGTDTAFLNTYFNRFQIDPQAYEDYTNQQGNEDNT